MSWFVGNKGIAKHHANRKTTMAYTELRFRDEARTKTLAGVAALSDAVRITLGPESWAELIEKNWGSPLVCDDGVTIAKAVKLKDPVESRGLCCSRRQRLWRSRNRPTEAHPPDSNRGPS